jgi:hypothetical protein
MFKNLQFWAWNNNFAIWGRELPAHQLKNLDRENPKFRDNLKKSVCCLIIEKNSFTDIKCTMNRHESLFLGEVVWNRTLYVYILEFV